MSTSPRMDHEQGPFPHLSPDGPVIRSQSQSGEDNQQPSEGPQIEVVNPDKDVIAQSCIEPVAFSDGDDRFLLMPVECPKGIFERRIIVPAYYEAHCVKEHKYPYRGGMKVCLTWNFFLSGCGELLLPQHFNIKEETRRSPKYFNQWLQFSGGKYPRAARPKYMSPRIFLQKTAIVYVRLATPKFPDNTDMPELCSYPIVGYVKEVINNGQSIA